VEEGGRDIKIEMQNPFRSTMRSGTWCTAVPYVIRAGGGAGLGNIVGNAGEKLEIREIARANILG
jgi:hypothetical protein